MATTLLELPPEILEHIAEELTSPDILSLRLVCREIENKTLRPFTKAHFTNRSVLLSSPGSLRTAIQIAKHRELGPACRTLHLFVNAFDIPENTMDPWNYGPGKHTKVNELVLSDLSFECSRPLVTPEFQAWNLLHPSVTLGQEIFNIIAVALGAHKSSGRLLESLNSFSMHTDEFHMPLQPIGKPDLFWPWHGLLRQFETLSICPRTDHTATVESPELGLRAFRELAASSKTKRLRVILSKSSLDTEWNDWLDTPHAFFAETFASLKQLHLQWASVELEELATFVHRQPVIESVVLIACLIWYRPDEDEEERGAIDMMETIGRLVNKPGVRVGTMSCTFELDVD